MHAVSAVCFKLLLEVFERKFVEGARRFMVTQFFMSNLLKILLLMYMNDCLIALE